MSLNLIIGKSDSGKSEYIMKKIMACDKQAILFVPSSMRVIAEQEYLKYTNKKGIVDLIITSIDRFVDRNVNKNELYNTKEYLPELAKKMLVRKVILENNELFEIFAKVRNNSNFIDRICSYIDSAKNQQLLPQDILDKYTKDDFLNKKLNEFTNIYAKVEEKLSERFISSIGELEYYISEISSTHMFENYEVFFDSYNNFSAVELQFIKALLLSGANVYITLEIDLDKQLNGITEIFKTTLDTLESLKKIAITEGIKLEEIKLYDVKNNRPSDVEFLASNIFDLTKNTYNGKSENIRLVLKENTYNEIEYIAMDIIKKVKEGYRYKDFVIYTNDIELYRTNIKRIFEMVKIPVYFNYEQSILSSEIMIYLLNVLKVVNDGLKKDISHIISLMKTGLITSTGLDEFENYVKEFGVNGYTLAKPFGFNNKKENSNIYNLELLNEIREKVLGIVNDLKEKLSNTSNSKEITKIIYEHLLNSGVIDKYEKILIDVENENVNEYNRKVQTISKLYEIMDNIVLAYDEISVKEYTELLEYGSREISVDTIPEKNDQVYVADINKNRGTEKKIGYVIGAYDGGLPVIQNEDNIFTDIELKKLKEVDIDLKQSKIDRNNMQLFNIYQAINKVREQLIVTVPSSKMTGGSLRPSSLIQTIKNIVDVKLESDITSVDSNISLNFMALLTKIANINDDTTDGELQEMYNEFKLYTKCKKYNEILNYIRQDKNLEKETLELIYKENINSSVSRLEQFKRCPFAYYTNYILNLKENKEYKVTNLDLGSLMHEVLEEISNYIVAKNIAWQDIVLNEKTRILCYREIDNIVDKIFNETYSKYLVTPRYLVLKGKLKNNMKKILYAISESFNHSDFRPLGYEISFEDGALFAPIKIELDNGKNVFLRGKIDRIDSANINGNSYLRIVDYKSSKKDLKLSDVKEGISLQLMAYMWAMIENKDKINVEGNVVPAAISYFTITSKLLSIPEYENDDMKLITQLKKELLLKGIYIKDVEILTKLDNNYNDSSKSFLGVNNRTLNNMDKVLPENVFIEECKNMKKILKEIALDMVKGNVSICPNSKVKDVCKYCKFDSMCRKNILN